MTGDEHYVAAEECLKSAGKISVKAAKNGPMLFGPTATYAPYQPEWALTYDPSVNGGLRLTISAAVTVGAHNMGDTTVRSMNANLSPGEARELAQALLDCADRMEGIKK